MAVVRVKWRAEKQEERYSRWEKLKEFKLVNGFGEVCLEKLAHTDDATNLANDNDNLALPHTTSQTPLAFMTPAACPNTVS